MSKDVASTIKDERVRRGWSQQDLGTHAGVAYRTISTVERGGRVSSETLQKIARALDLELALVPSEVA